MYSTCIHCQSDLGRNDLIEHLPIGRRIAFDAATGRLWVICSSCARWNLVPFESRYEAIEAGEKLYRGATQRMSTGEIGLAKTSEGTELVRIGKPIRPEMAAWRYGRNFTRRRWMYATTIAPASALLAFGGSAYVFLTYGSFGGVNSVAGSALPGTLIGMLTHAIQHRYIITRTKSRITVNDEVTNVSRMMARQVIVEPSDDAGARVWLPIVPERIEDYSWLRAFSLTNGLAHLIMTRRKGAHAAIAQPGFPTHHTLVEGDDAQRALRIILPLLNESGSNTQQVAEATAHISSTHVTEQRVLFGGRNSWDRLTRSDLASVYKPRRLALEMLVHEQSERRWLAGELLDLELEWRTANEIAAIADSILRDPAVEASLDALRDRSADTP